MRDGNASHACLIRATQPDPGRILYGTGSFTLDLTNMSKGVHLIGMRTRDANGGWSHDNKWLLALIPLCTCGNGLLFFMPAWLSSRIFQSNDR